MTHACEEHGVKLMIAYRLHFEPGNLRAIEIVSSGQIGEPRFFSSVFGQQVPAGNIRLEKSLDGGPLMDVGVYCINAARYLFRSEPEEVIAFGATINDDPRLQLMKWQRPFCGFLVNGWHPAVTSLGSPRSIRTVVETRHLQVSPGYGYHDERELTRTVGGKEQKDSSAR